jgi:intracellular sulfur oxidation DsrE/DsrF family protein
MIFVEAAALNGSLAHEPAMRYLKGGAREGRAMDEFRTDRRRLIGIGAVLAGAGAMAESAAIAQAGPSPGPRWEPAMESADSWLDKPGTRHRLVIDTTSGEGGREGSGYAIHFIYANQAAYGLDGGQLGVVLVFRHGSTPYGFNNAMWAKYGKQLSSWIKADSKQASTINPLLAKPPPSPAPVKGMEWAAADPLTALAGKGVRFAVCGLATKGLAEDIAAKNGNADAIDAELRANLVPGALMVPAGVVAVNRAQERGYTFGYTG